MRMLHLFRAAVLASLALAAEDAAASPPDTWSGRYVYTERAGHTAAGTPIVIAHEINIRRGIDRYRAEITATGYQTSVQLVAVAPITATRLVLRFERDGENQMFKGRYQPGDVLIVLERAPRTLFTHWHAYTPATLPRFRNPGIYFRQK